jgi:hypothetical protein
MEQGTSEDERLIFHNKANKGRKEPTLAVELEECKVKEGMTIVDTVVTRITGTSDSTYGELQTQRKTRSRSAGLKAETWVEEKFEVTDRHKARELEQEVEALDEFSWRTAKDEMKKQGIYYFKKDDVGYWIKDPTIPFRKRRDDA